MPTYAYEHCGQTVTVNRSITAPEVKPICGKCNKEMNRLYDKPAVTFRGTGWGHQR
jgi:putative FmdB family regulatory protein